MDDPDLHDRRCFGMEVRDALRRRGVATRFWREGRETVPYARTESVGAGVVAVAADAGAAAAGCPPPWPLGTVTGTLEEVVEMPRSLSTSLTVSPVALAIAEAPSPCWAICWIRASWESCTVSSESWVLVPESCVGGCGEEDWMDSSWPAGLE